MFTVAVSRGKSTQPRRQHDVRRSIIAAAFLDSHYSSVLYISVKQSIRLAELVWKSCFQTMHGPRGAIPSF